MRSCVMAAAFLAWAVVAVGCLDLDDLEPKEGDPCNAGVRCRDDQSMLSCEAGTFVSIPCRGPGGCSVSGTKLLCDPRGNLPGDRCAAANEERGFCSASDPNAALICRNGVFATLECRGECEDDGNQVWCAPAG